MESLGDLIYGLEYYGLKWRAHFSERDLKKVDGSGNLFSAIFQPSSLNFLFFFFYGLLFFARLLSEGS